MCYRGDNRSVGIILHSSIKSYRLPHFRINIMSHVNVLLFVWWRHTCVFDRLPKRRFLIWLYICIIMSYLITFHWVQRFWCFCHYKKSGACHLVTFKFDRDLTNTFWFKYLIMQILLIIFSTFYVLLFIDPNIEVAFVVRKQTQLCYQSFSILI